MFRPSLLRLRCPIKQRVPRANSMPMSTQAVVDFPFKTLVELQEGTCHHNKDKKVFGTRVGDRFEWITYGEFGREVQKFRNVLAHHKFGFDDKLALISNNRVEWAVAAFAVHSMGGQMIPMYEAQTEKDWKYIIDDSDAKMVLVANEKLYNQTKNYPGTIGKVEHVLSLDSAPELPHSYKRWMVMAEHEPAVPPTFPDPDHVASIIYTSGTTGNPKGVELTHRNIVADMEGLKVVYGQSLNNHTSLAFLPWAHVFGQSCELYALMATGSKLGIVPSREEILQCIPLLRPTIILSVPTLFNKVYAGVMKGVAAQSPLKQKLFHMALSISRERNELMEMHKDPGFFLNLQHSIADKVVLSKIREKLGGRLRFMASGGAATSVKVLQFFEDLGIPVCEGYGLTETAPVIAASCDNWNVRRSGTCGVVLHNLDVKIMNVEAVTEVPDGQEGEVWVAGPTVMKGYRKNKAANDEVFHHINGVKYFRTGDLARMVDSKFLKLTGRIKEQYKLENGKYVVPAPLEDMLQMSNYIHQALVFGDNKPFNSVLIVPEMAEIRAWCEQANITVTDDASMMALDSVKDLISGEIVHNSVLMKSFERPEKWELILEPFTQENQYMTPKMSYRRNNIIRDFKGLLANCYTDGSSAVNVQARQ